MMQAGRKVLIVGAGMCGMSLGVALTRAGIGCEIVEIRPELAEPGTGISLQGPALRALQTLGMLDQCISRGFGYSHFKACDAMGIVTATVDLPRLLGPNHPATIGILRQSVHEALAGELESLGVSIRLNTTVKTLSQDDQGVTLEFTNGETGRYDLVVGFDGANSLIREFAFGQQYRPRYTGQMVWRATVSRPPDVECRHSYFGPTNKSGFNPISETQMYIYTVQNVSVRPHWNDAELPGILRGLLAEFGGALGRARDDIRAPEQITCRPVFSMILQPPWHCGRILVIGDAAHTTTPHLASGASIAIEDSILLARLLKSGHSLNEVLDGFMHKRYKRCRMIVENSELLGEWEKHPGSPNEDTVGIIAKSYQELAKPI
jgi:2-polyprenyl-6-methoxyphenol hydroxylase-like FAD-dependent oxidoreductase